MKNTENKYTEVIIAVLRAIEREMERCHFNTMQKELVSPFANTGAHFVTPTFQVHAYNWGMDEDTPHYNFAYKGLKVEWYKHVGRGCEYHYEGEEPLTIDFLAQMLDDCFNAIEDYYINIWTNQKQ